MTDQSPARRLSDKIKAAWQHALDMGREEIADRLGLLYEATIMQETEKYPQRRRRDSDGAAIKHSTQDEATPARGEKPNSSDE